MFIEASLDASVNSLAGGLVDGKPALTSGFVKLVKQAGYTFIAVDHNESVSEIVGPSTIKRSYFFGYAEITGRLSRTAGYTIPGICSERKIHEEASFAGKNLTCLYRYATAFM